MPLAFAYSTINWGETPDLPAVLRAIAEAGWRAVELFGHSLDWLGPHTLVRDQCAAVGLIPATFFGAVTDVGDPVERERHRRRIDYAAALGATAYGIVGTGRQRQRAPSPDERARLARWLEELAMYGTDRGVTVAYHPHVGTTVETAAEIDQLLDKTERLQLCLDFSHVALVGEDPVQQWRRYRERTAYVHLKDWARGSFTELGRGTLGLYVPAILEALLSAGFPGWVVVEQSRSEVSPEESLAVNSAYLRQIGYEVGRGAAERTQAR